MTDNVLSRYDWRSNMDAPGGIPTGGYPARNVLAQGPMPSGSERAYDYIRGFLPQSYVWDRPANVLAQATAPFTTDMYDVGADYARTGQPAMLAMSLLPGMKPAAKAAQTGVKTAENALAKGIRAYHGSPHDFDRFDMSKIGTGEGAQAYGHGLYFAEAEGVAKQYRDKLKKDAKLNSATDRFQHLTIDGQPLGKQYDIDASHVDELKTLIANDDQNAVKSFLNGKRQRWQMISADPTYPFPDYAADKLKAYDSLINRVGSGGKIEDAGAGRLYEVNIKADPEDFLDWDKPLSQQSEKVRGAIQKWKDKPFGPDQINDASTGRDFQRLLQRPGTTKELTEFGLKGIRYLDQGSRTAGEGSRNYVVFDDNLIEILRKYGLLPPAAVGGAVMAGQSGEAQAMP